jgi:hypothetical protein
MACFFCPNALCEKRSLKKAEVIFIKVAIEQDFVVPSYFMSLVTKVQPIKGNSSCHEQGHEG